MNRTISLCFMFVSFIIVGNIFMLNKHFFIAPYSFLRNSDALMANYVEMQILSNRLFQYKERIGKLSNVFVIDQELSKINNLDYKDLDDSDFVRYRINPNPMDWQKTNNNVAVIAIDFRSFDYAFTQKNDMYIGITFSGEFVYIPRSAENIWNEKYYTLDDLSFHHSSERWFENKFNRKGTDILKELGKYAIFSTEDIYNTNNRYNILFNTMNFGNIKKSLMAKNN